MAQFYRDFQNDTLGAAPPGFTARGGGAASVTLTVQYSSGQDRNYLRYVKASDPALQMASLDVVGTVTDVETAGLVSVWDEGENGTRIAGQSVRFSGTSPSESFVEYSLARMNDEQRIQFTRSDAGAQVTPTQVNYPWVGSIVTLYAVRTQTIGTTRRMKIWVPANPFTNPTADEPATWQIDTTNALVTAAGRVGITRASTTNGSNGDRWFAFGVGTGGDPAPLTSGVLATPVPVVTSLTPPTTVGGTNGSATVTWPAVSGATAYRVELNSGAGFVIVEESNTSRSRTYGSLPAGSYTAGVTAKS